MYVSTNNRVTTATWHDMQPFNNPSGEELICAVVYLAFNLYSAAEPMMTLC